MTNLYILRVLAFLEGLSYIALLGICMPLKYMYDYPEPTRPVGMIHGVLFIAYIVWVVLVGANKKWSLATYFWAIIASLLPFGTFVADVKIFKEKPLESAPVRG